MHLALYLSPGSPTDFAEEPEILSRRSLMAYSYDGASHLESAVRWERWWCKGCAKPAKWRMDSGAEEHPSPLRAQDKNGRYAK